MVPRASRPRGGGGWRTGEVLVTGGGAELVVGRSGGGDGRQAGGRPHTRGSWVGAAEPLGQAPGEAPAGTLPCLPRPGLGGGTYLRRLSRPCLLELLLRSAELLMMLAGAQLPVDLA